MTGMRYQPQGRAMPARNVRGLRLTLNGSTPGRAATGQSVTQTGQASRVPAVFGVAQSFNGTNQALSIPLDLRNTEAVTVVALVDGLVNTGAQQILWEFGSDTVGTRQGFDAYVNSSGLLEVWTGSNGTQREGNTYILPVGQHVIACTYDHTLGGSSQVALYVDGVKQTRTGVVASGVPRGAFLSSTLYVAARTASSSWANIRVGGFLLFDRTLAPEEIPYSATGIWQFFDEPEEDASETFALASVSATAQWIEQSEATQAQLAASVRATNAWTEGSEASNLAGRLNVLASAAWVEASESTQISGRFDVLASAAWAEGSESTSAQGMVGNAISVVAAWVEGSESSSIGVNAKANVSIAFTEQSESVSAGIQVGSAVSANLGWVEASDSVAIQGNLRASLLAGWVEGSEFQDLRATSGDQSSEIDALLVPARQTVVFEGSRRIVVFEGSKRVVSFEGSKRMVDFQ